MVFEAKFFIILVENKTYSGPYLGFESNFCFFTYPILGVRDKQMKQPDN